MHLSSAGPHVTLGLGFLVDIEAWLHGLLLIAFHALPFLRTPGSTDESSLVICYLLRRGVSKTQTK